LRPCDHLFIAVGVPMISCVLRQQLHTSALLMGLISFASVWTRPFTARAAKPTTAEHVRHALDCVLGPVGAHQCHCKESGGHLAHLACAQRLYRYLLNLALPAMSEIEALWRLSVEKFLSARPCSKANDRVIFRCCAFKPLEDAA